MTSFFKDKGVGFYVTFAAAALGLVNAVIYAAYAASVQHFSVLVFVLLLAAAFSCALPLLTSFDFAPIVPGVLFSAAFAVYLEDRVIMFEEMINGIYGMSERGAILGVVLLILGIALACVACSIAAAFAGRTRHAAGDMPAA